MKKTTAANVYVFTNGCPMRRLDVSRLARYFAINGCKLINSPRKADYIIFVTCSYKKSREEECFKYIQEFRKYNGELIIAGCLPALAPLRMNHDFKCRFVTTDRLDSIDSLFPDFKIKFRNLPDANSVYSKPLSVFQICHLYIKKFFTQFELSKSFYKRCLRLISLGMNKQKNLLGAYLRIGYGCPETCAYCSIRRAVGGLRSKPIDVCLQEYRNLLEEGYRKFTILADNVGAYGLDINSSFAELLEKLSTIDRGLKVYWHIEHLHPRWVIKYKSEILKRTAERKIESIICPFQSGSNRILELMNRHHGTEEISVVLSQLKEANPDLRLSTYVIVGFPSETEEDFLATLYTLKKIRFYHVTIFPYYDDYDTIASKMEYKNDNTTILRRLRMAMNFLKRERLRGSRSEFY